MSKNSKMIRTMVMAAICLALCMVLPFITGQIPQIGSALSPMHIPVLLCGFICGPIYGIVVGFVAPLLRFALFGMPKIFPTGLAMAFELAAYGAATGLMYKLLPKKNICIYLSLIVAMLAGRVVWGCVMAIISVAASTGFTFAAFIAGAFINAVPGIILHIVLIPPIIMALRKNRLMVVST